MDWNEMPRCKNCWHRWIMHHRYLPPSRRYIGGYTEQVPCTRFVNVEMERCNCTHYVPADTFTSALVP